MNHKNNLMMKKRNMKERKSRVIAQGEVTGHSHIIIGECEIIDKEDGVYIKAGKNCAIKHLLEIPFVEEGKEIWTQEHDDIPLKKGETYKYIQQQEYNPYEKVIEQVMD